MSSIKEQIETFLLDLSSGSEEKLLVELWRNWSMVMGPYLEGIAYPLGRREKTLIVGGEDTMALQELAYMKEELLERVNAFMDRTFFDKVDLQLCMGRQLVYKKQVNQRNIPRKLKIPRQHAAEQSDSLVLDSNSPISRCYKTYLRMGDT
ncbi:DUF721 domain-containing protein [Lawsonia intracellularis]|uniref:DUF721 domain-containing protein n=2 Tax=Lawsonia intracellularis TaxID=29546 RepID=Q1MRJ2_LAWIP|nr:DUF721 domain-containing protein [Lawsonia intracellularis]AGC49741.1 hypothetical protein LAW_00340 [Lawsonia intracellularis N343]KAA0205247.1 DUF721 domain-containing protein [Lawsonia intracellularis]MBZ3892223.1 DUF721 domain-containing protein [Lawsonia intracellularis]RBN32206.1 DUF721 domain-containing protein [Lawsonia intracellularis]RBN33774.1 DUF721 domain-containing protein [Lawsonia intracellularis]